MFYLNCGQGSVRAGGMPGGGEGETLEPLGICGENSYVHIFHSLSLVWFTLFDLHWKRSGGKS